jgi:3-oxoacyl-[acyl-carrier protein] reductase
LEGRGNARSATWGRIIDIRTDGGDCFPGAVSYRASTLAMEGFSRSAAVELGPLGITVNVVSLGMVQTGWVSAEMERWTARQYPLRRIGQPGDVADVVVFLASEQARWLTGQLLYAGGGHALPH